MWKSLRMRVNAAFPTRAVNNGLGHKPWGAEESPCDTFFFAPG